VKKTRLLEYDSNRSGGLIAINLRENGEDGEDGSPVRDEVVAARMLDSVDDLLLVSRKGQSLRFTATDEALRPMGRATSGVTGMKFRDGDELLAMDVVRLVEVRAVEGVEDPDTAAPISVPANGAAEAEVRHDVFVVFENGLAKRTRIAEYRVQGRGGLGIKVAKMSSKGGDLVGALMVGRDDEVLVVMEKGKVVRSRVAEVRLTGRDTSGVKFATPDRHDSIIAVARNNEHVVDSDDDPAAGDEAGTVAATSDGVPSVQPETGGDV
jgi:DNA gyrase subunit A